MRLLVSVLDLKADDKLIAEYLQAHKNVEPAITDCMAKYGIVTAQVRRAGDRLVQVILVNDDFDEAAFNAAMQADPACVDWNERMKAYQQKVPAAKPEEWWADTEVAFEFRG